MTGPGEAAPDPRLADRRARRLVIGLWTVVALLLWNGLYDVQIAFGIREYLLQAALHDAGRGPAVDLPDVMQVTVRESVRFATFWTSLVLGAALCAARLTGRQ